MSRGPYDQALDHQFWRRAVGEVPNFALDPIVSVPFVIADGDKVATAGSCFAQHIAAQLQADGSNYYIVETAPTGLPPKEALRRGYGLFTCRYANIYTARQLLQLGLRAYGRLAPMVEAWQRDDGCFVDPFRPLVEPEGFPDIAAVRADRETHFAAVRRMIETADVFVFTLGQTECWRFRGDGVVVPVAPGIAGGKWSEAEYSFYNMSASDVIEDVIAFIDLMRSVNAKARVILTVSPVPLAATWEKRHALISNTISKATLCIAAAEICATRDDVAYFPSYELVTTPGNAARFFEDDQRHVTPLGVAHVMRLFLKHFRGGKRVTRNESIDVAAEAGEMKAIVCEEDLIDRV